MDIFGVGLGELVVIVFLLLIVAGPKRSMMWARQAGEYLRQFREAWQRMVNEFREDLGEEGEAFMRTAQEFQRTASEIRHATSTRNVVNQAVRLADGANRKPPLRQAGTASQSTEPHEHGNGASEPPESDAETGDRYGAWQLPPE
ncbi:MAG: hypothetical protein GYB66_08375 [Chloroflexi bacterium]|nr:hypothetical protein [Chloroflexota bacterium]